MSNILNSIKNAFKKEEIMTARTAYYKSRYGKYTSDEELLNDLLKDINESIKYKCMQNKYCAMFEINDDKEKFIPYVVEQYKKNGYQAIVIGNETNLNGNVLNNLSSMFLILIWNNLTLIEERTENKTNSIEYAENA